MLKSHPSGMPLLKQKSILTLFQTTLIILISLLSLTSCQTKSKESKMNDKKYNRLIHEKSPYLLQHAENPVDWYPWSEEAFAAAKAQDKPIFLSIGYATCHWCHVMAHESFEDSAVAKLMNEAFINIKVDREERPDIDNIYMTVCQMLTQSGGWPLTIIMTPDKQPFFAATYIPKNRRFNRPGMMELIPLIREAWQKDRQKILASAERISQALVQVANQRHGEALNDTILEAGYMQLSHSYDQENGGFGDRPKFPTPHNLMFLMRYYLRTQNPQVLEMVTHTLTQMRLGGIFDHLGYGFHRYSTDAHWLVPHFEKMLYDQAMLAFTYTEAFQITNNLFFAQTAREVLDYVLRVMTDSQGGFYSAEDADSEGEEGKFYLWSETEIREVLQDEADFFISVYNVLPEGNYTDEISGYKTGKNILYLSESPENLAQLHNLDLTTFQKKITALNTKLFNAREKRIHPLKDDKILTDWNGLMITAFSKAARTLDSPKYEAAAEKAYKFIQNNLTKPTGHLLHRYRNSDAAIDAYLDDYAFMIWGMLELYQTTFNTNYLQQAIDYTKILKEEFWDQTHYGYFFTGESTESPLARKKEFYDGAIPSGNSVMMLNLLKLAHITGDMTYADDAEKVGQAFSEAAQQSPGSYTMLLSAVEFATGNTQEIVITGDWKDQLTQQFLKTIQSLFLPNAIINYRPPQNAASTIDLIPYTKDLTPLNNLPTVYICRNFTCELPITDLPTLKSKLIP
jgi:hypothetical protein